MREGLARMGKERAKKKIEKQRGKHKLLFPTIYSLTIFLCFYSTMQ